LTAGTGGVVGQVHVGMGDTADRLQGFFDAADARRAGGAGDRQLNAVVVGVAGIVGVAVIVGVAIAGSTRRLWHRSLIRITFFAAAERRCLAGTAAFGDGGSGIKNLRREARFGDSAGSVGGVDACGQGDGLLLDVHLHHSTVGDQRF